MTWFKWRYFLYLFIIGVWAVWFINIRIMFSANDIAVDCDKSINKFPVGIVLGARIIESTKVSDVYADRLQTAADIYKKGKIDKILVSGDHGQTTYDEVNAGRDYLLKQDIPAVDIFLDHAGFDTYDSIYRAQKIFGINRALIITQEYHLPRALYFAKNLDMDALGCKADLHEYTNINQMKGREILARVKAWISNACKVKPKYLGETYDITGDGQKTWDRLSY